MILAHRLENCEIESEYESKAKEEKEDEGDEKAKADTKEVPEVEERAEEKAEVKKTPEKAAHGKPKRKTTKRPPSQHHKATASPEKKLRMSKAERDAKIFEVNEKISKISSKRTEIVHKLNSSKQTMLTLRSLKNEGNKRLHHDNVKKADVERYQTLALLHSKTAMVLEGLLEYLNDKSLLKKRLNYVKAKQVREQANGPAMSIADTSVHKGGAADPSAVSNATNISARCSIRSSLSSTATRTRRTPS